MTASSTASFDDKVEALRRLRDKRQARTSTAAQADAEVVAPSLGLSGAEVAATSSAAEVKEKKDPCEPGGAGETDALFCAGHCLEHGLHGCEVDHAAAAAIYAEAAEQDHAVAQWRLGELYEFGRGVQQNDSIAVHWYRKAAEAGNPSARACLALLLEAGRGCERDNVEAARWYLLAAEEGHALAQYCIAKCFMEGRGVSPDPEIGSQWLQKSAAAGFPPALEAIEAAFDELGPDCDDEAQSSRLDEDSSEDLLGLANRLAKQMQHLSDEEADTVLKELFQDLPENLEEIQS